MWMSLFLFLSVFTLSFFCGNIFTIYTCVMIIDRNFVIAYGIFALLIKCNSIWVNKLIMYVGITPPDFGIGDEI